MSENNKTKRYKIDNFRAKSLEGNPLHTTEDRDVKIYLPPGYFENRKKRYPVIYFLHGYGGNNRGWAITSQDSKDRALPLELIPRKILKEIDVDRLPNFEKLDDLITSGDLAPFIFVQPDGSLHAPHKDGLRDFMGRPQTKGSFYVNSPFTGNYMDYIINDVIDYIDSNYQTIADKQHRALMGGSMGGYGTIFLCIHHPDKFISAVSLSPGNVMIGDMLDWKLRVPIYEKIFGEKMSAKMGDATWDDILDTYDLIFSNNNHLMSSIKRDDNGNIMGYNEEAFKNWQKYDLNNLIKKNPEALKKVHLLINCEMTDEFGLAEVAKKIHETLTGLGIEHIFDLYSDPRAALTPHVLGSSYNVLPGIRFCIQNFS